MKKTIISFLCLLTIASSAMCVKADVIPQDEKGVSVCQRIINLNDYKDYNFYVISSANADKNSPINETMIIKDGECIKYYKLFGGLIIGVNKETNKRISASSNLFGTFSTVKEDDPIKSKEEYYKIKVEGSDIKLTLEGGKKFFENGTFSDYNVDDIENISDDNISETKDYSDIIRIVALFLSAGLISLCSILIYKKVTTKK